MHAAVQQQGVGDATEFSMKDTAWQVPTAPLPQLQGRINADVCVVGLGGTGLAALRRLQKNKVRRIVGLDAVGLASGAAGRNGGFLLAGPAHFHHRAVAAWGASIAQDLYRLTLDAIDGCPLYTSPSPRDRTRPSMPSAA